MHLHRPQHITLVGNVSDDIIPLGVEYWASRVRQELALPG
jgi:hypothetical protein